MSTRNNISYAGLGGDKLRYALEAWAPDLDGATAADFGCNIGGFTGCLLLHGVRRVYAVDTGYGMLQWKLRCDPRVVVMERTNAMHVTLPEPVDIVTIDVAWTPQKHILPSALNVVQSNGCILSLFKPQYEADPALVRRGRIAADAFDTVLQSTLDELESMHITVVDALPLPRTKQRKNPEAMLYIRPRTA